MDSLNNILHEQISSYVGNGVNGYSYLIANAERTDWTIIFVLDIAGKRTVRPGLIVRLTNDHILIEADTNDPPLVDTLTQSGVPRSQIILAYDGEPIPE